MSVHRGRWTRDDRAESMYRYVPVDVPAGAEAIEVSLEYDRSAGVLDLGCFGAGGYRGWSGGARDRFVIGADAGTPGYLPGELEPGQWQVVLGLHRVGPAGVPFTVRAQVGSFEPSALPPDPAVPSRPERRELPAPPGMRWLAGDLHAHTVHSDGSLTVAELAAAAVREGLDFLAVTDHNTTSHHRSLAGIGSGYGVTLLPGQEVTTDTGHANAFGDIGWIDFREPSSRWADEVGARGGLLSINHPLAGDCAWRRPLATRPPLAEIWHSSWLDPRWGGPISWWEAWGSETIPVGGSDFHTPAQGRPVGRPTTWVCCADESAESIMDGLRAGRTAVTAGRAEPAVLRVENEILALDADGTLLVDSAGRRSPVRGDRACFPAGPGPYRLDDHDGGIVALCA